MFIKRQTIPNVLRLCIMSFTNSKKLFAELLFKNDSMKLKKKNDRYSNKHVFVYIYITILHNQMNQFFTTYNISYCIFYVYSTDFIIPLYNFISYFFKLFTYWLKIYWPKSHLWTIFFTSQACTRLYIFNLNTFSCRWILVKSHATHYIVVVVNVKIIVTLKYPPI